MSNLEKERLKRFIFDWDLDYDHDQFLLSLYRQVLVGSLLKRGKKIWSLKRVLKIFLELKKSEHCNPLIIFLLAL